MAGLSTIIASYRKKVYANSIICLGFDPVHLVPVVRINEVLRGRWEGFYLKKQEPQLFLLLKQKAIKRKNNVNSLMLKHFLMLN